MEFSLVIHVSNFIGVRQRFYNLISNLTLLPTIGTTELRTILSEHVNFWSVTISSALFKCNSC